MQYHDVKLYCAAVLPHYLDCSVIVGAATADGLGAEFIDEPEALRVPLAQLPAQLERLGSSVAWGKPWSKCD
jgi:hypothetical protein